jgi:hypothetical protein
VIAGGDSLLAIRRTPMRERDLRGMTVDGWTRRTAKPQQKLASFQRFFQALAGGSSAGSAREAA